MSGGSAQDTSATMEPRAQGSRGFIWPPLERPPDEPQPLAPPKPAPAPEPAPAWRATRALWEIETAWLGVSGRSWSAASRAEGWSPDKPGEYCPRCATTAGPFEADASGCPACRVKRLAWSRALRLGRYEGPLRDAILTGKYTAWRRTCQDLGRDLGSAVAAALREAGVGPELVVVCPVATSRRRRLARGVDHTAILAREVARATGGRLCRALRRRHRPPQQGLSLESRRRNVAGSFRPNLGVCAQLEGRVVVLVDDVRTTGATLSAASRSLREGIRKAGSKEQAVWTAVLAVAGRR